MVVNDDVLVAADYIAFNVAVDDVTELLLLMLLLSLFAAFHYFHNKETS